MKKLKKEVDVLHKEIEMMKHTISKAPENLQKLKDEMEVKQNKWIYFLLILKIIYFVL